MARSRNSRQRRGRPIGSRNTRVNQYIRIRSLIWKERKDLYKSYFDPALLDIARRVNDECKTAGTDCNDEVVLSFHDEMEQGGRKYPLPILNPSLFNPRPYWEIKNVSDWAIESANIYFYSPMLIAPPSGFRSLDFANYIDADGRKRLSLDRGYRRYFKEWVDWVNTYYRDEDINDSELMDVSFMCLPAEWDEEKGFWIVEIVSCTPDGRISDFGFTPTTGGDFTSPQPTFKQQGEQQPQQTTQQQPQQQPPPTRTVEQVEAEQLEKDREFARLKLMKDEAKEDYKFWKADGDTEEADAAKQRIKEITKQIDNLRSGN